MSIFTGAGYPRFEFVDDTARHALHGLTLREIEIYYESLKQPAQRRSEMTDAEAIDAVRNGRRAVTAATLHADAKPDGCPGFNHDWRIVACDGRTDVAECRNCGKQEITSCHWPIRSN